MMTRANLPNNNTLKLVPNSTEISHESIIRLTKIITSICVITTDNQLTDLRYKNKPSINPLKMQLTKRQSETRRNQK